MTQIVALLNQKGGVGKTTTTINLASYLAKAGKTVLIVDLDPQGNATSGLSINKDAVEVSSYNVLLDSAELQQAVLETSVKGLFIVPTNAHLAGAEVELPSLQNREFRLKKALSGVAFDYVLIDCPPSLGLLSINALVAANWLIIPVQAEYYALEGLGQLMNVFQLVRSGLNPDINVLGVLMTMYDSRTSLSEQVKNEVLKHFAGHVFDTVIPRNVRLAEAPSFGRPISEHDKWSKGARAYKQLAKEVQQRVKLS